MPTFEVLIIFWEKPENLVFYERECDAEELIFLKRFHGKFIEDDEEDLFRYFYHNNGKFKIEKFTQAAKPNNSYDLIILTGIVL